MAPSRSRSIDIAGDATNAIVVTGDGNVIIVHSAGRKLYVLTPLTTTPSIPSDIGPAMLLTTQYEVVDFIGRDGLLNETRQWLGSSPDRAVRLISGQGGQGKSRLALQIARNSTPAGWQVFFVRHARDGALISHADTQESISICDRAIGTLAIVDYADRWPSDDLRELLVRLEGPGRVRVLLLSRSDSFWPTFSRTLAKSGIGVSSISLEDGELDHQQTRKLMFETATRSFAAALKLTADPQEVAWPDLTHSAFSLTLSIHMAALIAVFRLRDGVPKQPRATDPAELSRELLVREVDHWQQMTRRDIRPVRLSTEDMARAVLVATLCRGLPITEALALLDELPIGAAPQIVVDDHALCYPPSSSDFVLEPLYPDRLGEDFIAAVLPGAPSDRSYIASLDFLIDPTAPVILDRLLQLQLSDGWLANAALSTFVMLVEAAHRWDHVAVRYLSPLLDETRGLVFAISGGAIERVSNIPALAPMLPRIGLILEFMIGTGSNVLLDRGAAAVQEQLLRYAEAEDNTNSVITALTNLTVRLGAVGRHDEALNYIQRAVALCRERVAGDRGTYLAALATCLINTTRPLITVGRLTDAAASAQEATIIYRELASQSPESYARQLAGSLGNLSTTFSQLGRHQEALELAKEATGIFRQLATREKHSDLSDLAQSLYSLANCHKEVGQSDRALPLAEEAVNLLLELASDSPERHLQNLAVALNGLATCLSSVNRLDDAFAHTRKAIKIYRDLVGLDRECHLSDLAMSIYNLANYLAQAKDFTEAIEQVSESVTLYRELTAKGRASHLPGLARSLHNLGVYLGEAGRSEEALTHVREAVALRRELVADARHIHLPRLAGSVYFLAFHLSETKHYAEAFKFALESMELYHELSAHQPTQYLPEFANALKITAICMLPLGGIAEALGCARHAVKIYQLLAGLSPENFGESLTAAHDLEKRISTMESAFTGGQRRRRKRTRRSQGKRKH